MTIDASFIYWGGFILLFLLCVVISYFIVKKIERSATCFECNNLNWKIDHEEKEDEKNIYDYIVFKCTNCGHVRNKYCGRIIKKE